MGPFGFISRFSKAKIVSLIKRFFVSPSYCHSSYSNTSILTFYLVFKIYFYIKERMVGIYNKLKNGLNWIKGKAMKYVAPAVGQLGEWASSDLVKGVAGMASPFLDTIAPGLGTGINKGLGWLGTAGNIANGLSADYQEQGDKLGFSDMFANIKSGKYTKGKTVASPKGGITLSKRPDDLHPRTQLKELTAGDDGEGRPTFASYVEELD
jgi:hypothetical protein